MFICSCRRWSSVTLDRALKSDNILAVFHYLPLHASEMGQRFGGRPGDCPVTEDNQAAAWCGLPFYNGLAAGDQSRVIEIDPSSSPIRYSPIVGVTERGPTQMFGGADVSDTTVSPSWRR